jgi:uncharacterized protein (TIGR03086 family)
MDLLPMYERELERTGQIVSGVRPEHLDRPTPCSQWDTRTLLNHLIGGSWMWAMLGTGQQLDTSKPAPDFAADDPTGAYLAAGKAALEAFRAPGAMERTFATPIGPVPGAVALGLALTDTVIHGWDLATATSQPSAIDPRTAETVLEMSRAGLSPEFRQPPISAFADEVPVGPDATATDRLVAFLGRQPAPAAD